MQTLGYLVRRMAQPLLDDPKDWKRPPVKPGRMPFYTWWTMGLGMGIALLLVNLLDLRGYFPEMLINTDFWQLGTHELLVWLVFTVGSLLLSQWLLDETPGVTVSTAALQGLGSGFLAESIYVFLKIIGLNAGEVLGSPVKTLFTLTLMALYGALICASRIHLYQGRPVWQPLLALLIWMVLKKLFGVFD
jgi:hypothetical protein